MPLAPDTTTVDAEDRARGVPGYLAAPVIDRSDSVAFVPAVQANIARGTFRDGNPLTHESTVRAILPELDLAANAERSGRRIDFNDRAGPMAAAFTPLADYATVGSVARTGAAPRSLAVSRDGSRLYVHAWLDRRLEVYDISGVTAGMTFDPPLLTSVALAETETLAADVLAGKRIFYDASDPRMGLDGYISCSSCHLDGGHDGLTWDFTDRGEGLRNTIDLRGRAGLGHGPLHWSANFDEVQDFEHDIRGAFGGIGFLSDDDFESGTRDTPLGDAKAGLSPDLDALAAYVSSLDTFPRSPARTPEGAMDDAALRGETLYDTLDCASCHAGAERTDSGTARYDVGTFGPGSGARLGATLDGLDVPTLRGLHDGAPYLHDGSAASLEDVLVTRNIADAHTAVGLLSNDALSDLIAFLLALE